MEKQELDRIANKIIREIDNEAKLEKEINDFAAEVANALIAKSKNIFSTGIIAEHMSSFNGSVYDFKLNRFFANEKTLYVIDSMNLTMYRKGLKEKLFSPVTVKHATIEHLPENSFFEEVSRTISVLLFSEYGLLTKPEVLSNYE